MALATSAHMLAKLGALAGMALGVGATDALTRTTDALHSGGCYECNIFYRDVCAEEECTVAGCTSSMGNCCSMGQAWDFGAWGAPPATANQGGCGCACAESPCESGYEKQGSGQSATCSPPRSPIQYLVDAADVLPWSNAFFYGGFALLLVVQQKFGMIGATEKLRDFRTEDSGWSCAPALVRAPHKNKPETEIATVRGHKPRPPPLPPSPHLLTLPALVMRHSGLVQVLPMVPGRGNGNHSLPGWCSLGHG